MEKVISKFIERHYNHYNAATLKDAAVAYKQHLQNGGKMFLTLAGAMSTAELGKSLAEMIRQDKVHAICCTGANLEEDLFNLVAHNHYVRIPKYRYLSSMDEKDLFNQKLRRVTDTCIPEDEAIGLIEKFWVSEWYAAQKPALPHEYLYRMLDHSYDKLPKQIDPMDSWLVAAWQKRLPLFVPGWEDSTLGNKFAALCFQGKMHPQMMSSGIEYMTQLMRWYASNAAIAPIGFFQIGGGISGDFSICVVPCLLFDLKIEVPTWAYFCQISDCTTSYGSYSGAVPNEKITWGKLEVNTPQFMIESDATIVVPLIFAYVLEW
ncbi:deoxyhypusine synthase family protein [Deltaproteobacteria bacterium TL4]